MTTYSFGSKKSNLVKYLASDQVSYFNVTDKLYNTLEPSIGSNDTTKKYFGAKQLSKKVLIDSSNSVLKFYHQDGVTTPTLPGYDLEIPTGFTYSYQTGTSYYYLPRNVTYNSTNTFSYQQIGSGGSYGIPALMLTWVFTTTYASISSLYISWQCFGSGGQQTQLLDLSQLAGPPYAVTLYSGSDSRIIIQHPSNNQYIIIADNHYSTGYDISFHPIIQPMYYYE